MTVYDALPAVLLAAALALVGLRLRLGDLSARGWWLQALLPGPSVAALAGGLLAAAAPAWMAAVVDDLVPPALAFLAGWVGLRAGCGLDLRVVRRARPITFVYEAGMALAATVAVFLVAHVLAQAVPGLSAPAAGVLLVVAGVCVVGPGLPESAAASRGASRGGFWSPSATALLAILLAATGAALGPTQVFQVQLPGLSVPPMFEVAGVLERLLWGAGAGAMAGLVAELATRDDYAPGGLYPRLLAVLLVASGIAGAVGLNAALVGAVAGIWLVSATLRRLDILHVLQRSASLPRLAAPLLAGWLVGDALRSGSAFDGGLCALVLCLVALVRPVARLLGARHVAGALHRVSRRRRPETPGVAQVELDELGILLAAGVVGLLEPSPAAALLAAVLFGQWALTAGARWWEWRETTVGEAAAAASAQPPSAQRPRPANTARPG